MNFISCLLTFWKAEVLSHLLRSWDFICIFLSLCNDEVMLPGCFLLNCSFSRWDGYIFFVFGITLGKDACLYWGLRTAVKIRFLSTAFITSKLYQNIWPSAHLHILAWMTRAFLSPWNIAAGKYKHSKLFFFFSLSCTHQHR